MSKKSTQTSSIKFEVAGVSLILASIYIYISLFSTSSGIVGEKIRELALGIFGLGAYIVPVLIIILGLAMVYRKNAMQVNIKFYSFCIFLLATLIALFLANYKEVEGAGSQWLDAIKYYYALGALNTGGGALGGFFGYAFVMLFGIVGTITIVAALYIISILMFTEITFVSILEYLRNVITGMYARLKDRSKETAITMELQKKTAAKSKEELELIASDEERIRNMDKKIKILDFTKRFDKDFKNKDDKDIEEKPKELPKENMEVKETKIKQIKEQQEPKTEEVKIVPINNKQYANYKLPNMNLLSLPAENKSGNGKKEVMSNVKILEDTLKNFGVSANIAQVSVGPTITRYELQLSPGVKVSKILSLADDISLSLASPGIRIEAPYPERLQ